MQDISPATRPPNTSYKSLEKSNTHTHTQVHTHVILTKLVVLTVYMALCPNASELFHYGRFALNTGAFMHFFCM